MKAHWIVIGLVAALLVCRLFTSAEEAKPASGQAATGAAAAAQPGAAGAVPAPAAADAQAVQLTTTIQKVSYSIGINIGKNLKSQVPDVDVKALARGIESALTNEKPLLSDSEMREVMAAYQEEAKIRRMAVGEKNKKDGAVFLEENKKKPGVIALPSGLQYKVIQEGAGPKPKATDKVTTHYRGTLIDGTEFDSSYGRGQPTSFAVTGVIKGWTEALQLMPVGSKWQLFIPSELAYRERGSGPVIGPNATLIFEIELISID